MRWCGIAAIAVRVPDFNRSMSELKEKQNQLFHFFLVNGECKTLPFVGPFIFSFKLFLLQIESFLMPFSARLGTIVMKRRAFAVKQSCT